MIHITIERDRSVRASSDGARFRVKVYANGRALLSSSAAVQSVSKAKREAEEIFGELDWATDPIAQVPDVRMSATIRRPATLEEQLESARTVREAWDSIR